MKIYRAIFEDGTKSITFAHDVYDAMQLFDGVIGEPDTLEELDINVAHGLFITEGTVKPEDEESEEYDEYYDSITHEHEKGIEELFDAKGKKIRIPADWIFKTHGIPKPCTKLDSPFKKKL